MTGAHLVNGENLGLFQHTELEHTPFATFTNIPLRSGVRKLIVGDPLGLPNGVCFNLGVYCNFLGSKNSPTGPTERTPKPENLIALATSLGVRWDSVPFFCWWIGEKHFCYLLLQAAGLLFDLTDSEAMIVRIAQDQIYSQKNWTNRFIPSRKLTWQWKKHHFKYLENCKVGLYDILISFCPKLLQGSAKMETKIAIFWGFLLGWFVESK